MFFKGVGQPPTSFTNFPLEKSAANGRQAAGFRSMMDEAMQGKSPVLPNAGHAQLEVGNIFLKDGPSKLNIYIVTHE